MKLLLDQNISPHLVRMLNSIFPGSLHVQDVQLDRAEDKEVWDYAKKNDLIIVSKDVDFSERILLYGFPPKIIWIRRGNCSTKTILKILLNNQKEIKNLRKDDKLGILTLL